MNQSLFPFRVLSTVSDSKELCPAAIAISSPANASCVSGRKILSTEPNSSALVRAPNSLLDELRVFGQIVMEVPDTFRHDRIDGSLDLREILFPDRNSGRLKDVSKPLLAPLELSVRLLALADVVVCFQGSDRTSRLILLPRPSARHHDRGSISMAVDKLSFPTTRPQHDSGELLERRGERGL